MLGRAPASMWQVSAADLRPDLVNHAADDDGDRPEPAEPPGLEAWTYEPAPLRWYWMRPPYSLKGAGLLTLDVTRLDHNGWLPANRGP